MTTPAKPWDPGASQKQRGPAPPPPPAWRNWLVVAGLVLSLFLLFYPFGSSAGTALTYSQFLGKVRANQVSTATIDQNGAVSGTLSNGGNYTSQIPTALQDQNLAPLLEEHHVQVTGTGPPGGLLALVIS